MKEYFESLPKKEGFGSPIDDLATYFLPERNFQEFERVLKTFLVNCVACALDDSFNNNKCLVLYGPQGIGKSEFISWLIPPELNSRTVFFDSLKQIDYSGQFIINLYDSCYQHNSKDLERILAKKMFPYRELYRKTGIIKPRRASFFTSVCEPEAIEAMKHYEFYEIVEIRAIDFWYQKKIDVKDVWADAYAIYNLPF